VEGYRSESYGERFADVYDDLYHGVSDVPSTTRFLDELVRTATGGESGRVMELAAGTGRLAIPLAELGHDVTALDISPDMLDQLRRKDADRTTGGRVTTVVGDMARDLPNGPFDVVFIAFNSLFMLTDPDEQAACFASVASVLGKQGAFVLEPFVPYDPPRPGAAFELRSMTADRVVLSISSTDPGTQVVTGQIVDLVHGQPVTLRPYVLRYSTPAELDAFAVRAGLRLTERYEDFERSAFDDDSSFHVSVYRPDDS
jgi:SAM-dependent methyltransferase